MKKKTPLALITALTLAASTLLVPAAQAADGRNYGCSAWQRSGGHEIVSYCPKGQSTKYWVRHAANARFYFDSGYSSSVWSQEKPMGAYSYSGYHYGGKASETPKPVVW